MTHFSDFFLVDPKHIENHGAFNISLVTDLPLFIDPFLLFNSKKAHYQELHNEIIRYLVFLRDKARAGGVAVPLLKAWYCFPEVKQTWLGFSQVGNRGSGLGLDFAEALHENLHKLFPEFGSEKITKSSHLEKVCLIRDGVGRDNISDFTTNLIKNSLCEYTQQFAIANLKEEQRRVASISNAVFNYDTEVWEPKTYTLPWFNGDYVLLTPKDILTRDENWINKTDLIHNFDEIPLAIPDDQLRAQVSNYFERQLSRRRDREPTQKERAAAAVQTIYRFPELIDYFIKLKELQGEKAASISSEKVKRTEQVFVRQIAELRNLLALETTFYQVVGSTYDEAHARLAYLKDIVENKGAYRLFYVAGKPIQREQDLHIIYRLVWYGSPSDVSTEVNDGRGPADYKISRGAADKTIVEMKLAKNTHLKRNLANQAEAYQKASGAGNAIKVILFFSREEELKVRATLRELKLDGHKDVVLIDARRDNKPSGSRA